MSDIESRIKELESIVWFLQVELHNATCILDDLLESSESKRKFYWRQEWIDTDDGGYYRIQKFKVFPARERNLLIRELHNQGLSVRQIAVALLERNHRNSKGGIWSDSIIERVIDSFDGGDNAETE